MKKCYFFPRWLLLALCLAYPFNPAAAQTHSFYDHEPVFNKPAVQLGFKYAYISPLSNFGMEFGRAPQYELYCQMRNKNGNGRLSGRVGLYYTAPKPRLDTFPVYMIGEGSTTTLYPGYVSYQKFYLRGLFLEYAYRVVRYKGFSLDVGLGITIGQYRMEYEEGYATVLTATGIIDENVAGLRMHASLAYQINKRFELYAEGMNCQMTQTDWSAKFPNNTFGIGLNFTFNPATDNDR